MDPKMGAVSSDINNFEPSSDFIQEEECDTVLLYLPGFTKEQLRVQLARSGVLKISGRRPLGANKWSSFEKEFRVSANCDTNKISAKFEGGILYVRQPKLIVPAAKEEQKPAPSEIPQPQKPKQEPPVPKINQEQSQKATTNGDQVKKPNKKELSDKSVQEETKPVNEEKQSETEGAKNAEKNSEKTESDKKDASRDSSDKRDEISKKTDPKLVNKGIGANFMGKIDYSKLSTAIPAEKLKMARKTMNMVLVVLLAFGVGVYVSNRIWHSGKSEN